MLTSRPRPSKPLMSLSTCRYLVLKHSEQIPILIDGLLHETHLEALGMTPMCILLRHLEI